MSSKSAGHKSEGKNPYGNNPSRRGRSWFLVTTVVILLAVTGIWTYTYTQSIGASTSSERP